MAASLRLAEVNHRHSLLWGEHAVALLPNTILHQELSQRSLSSLPTVTSGLPVASTNLVRACKSPTHTHCPFHTPRDLDTWDGSPKFTHTLLGAKFSSSVRSLLMEMYTVCVVYIMYMRLSTETRRQHQIPLEM